MVSQPDDATPLGFRAASHRFYPEIDLASIILRPINRMAEPAVFRAKWEDGLPE
jgi:hypothetical protein